MKKRAEITVTGLVQGVLFRQGAREEAKRLELGGWVKNEDDGSVRIVAEGEEENLQKLIEWCKIGTNWAKVERVEAEWSDAKEDFREFTIR